MNKGDFENVEVLILLCVGFCVMMLKHGRTGINYVFMLHLTGMNYGYTNEQMNK